MKRTSQVISLSDWNKRYFTIEGDYLCWRKSKDRSASGSVKISEIKGIKQIKQNKTAFVVKAGERTLYLRSETVSDADRWVRSIQLQVSPCSEKYIHGLPGKGMPFQHLLRQFAQHPLISYSPLLPSFHRPFSRRNALHFPSV